MVGEELGIVGVAEGVDVLFQAHDPRIVRSDRRHDAVLHVDQQVHRRGGTEYDRPRADAGIMYRPRIAVALGAEAHLRDAEQGALIAIAKGVVCGAGRPTGQVVGASARVRPRVVRGPHRIGLRPRRG